MYYNLSLRSFSPHSSTSYSIVLKGHEQFRLGSMQLKITRFFITNYFSWCQLFSFIRVWDRQCRNIEKLIYLFILLQGLYGSIKLKYNKTKRELVGWKVEWWKVFHGFKRKKIKKINICVFTNILGRKVAKCGLSEIFLHKFLRYEKSFFYSFC